MIQSRLTSKAQTTIPAPVRQALGLKPGDLLTYEIEDGRVVMTRAGMAASDDPCAAFAEWGGAAVRAAYADF